MSIPKGTFQRMSKLWDHYNELALRGNPRAALFIRDFPCWEDWIAHMAYEMARA